MTGAADIALQVRNLSVRFGPNRQNSLDAVSGVDLDVRRGEIVGLVGESGSGKTVTVRAVMGILDPSTSVVDADLLKVNGETILEKGGKKARRRRPGLEGMAMVFQGAFTSLNPVFRIGTVLEEVIYRHQGVKGREAKDLALEALDAVRIPKGSDILRAYPHELSGGMQQRVGIAMALATNPRVLIADEPTTALDVTIQAQLLRLLSRLCEERDLSVVLVTHDLGLLAEISNRIYVMYAGRVVESGPADVVDGSALHPYTASLVEAIPPIDVRLDRLTAIPGGPPRLSARPTGCQFNPRCQRVQPECRAVEPELLSISETQTIACFNPLERSTTDTDRTLRSSGGRS